MQLATAIKIERVGLSELRDPDGRIIRFLVVAMKQQSGAICSIVAATSGSFVIARCALIKNKRPSNETTLRRANSLMSKSALC